MKERLKRDRYLDGIAFDEITYEGYGPNGVAIIIEVTTDNKNRSVAELRHILQNLRT